MELVAFVAYQVFIGLLTYFVVRRLIAGRRLGRIPAVQSSETAQAPVKLKPLDGTIAPKAGHIGWLKAFGLRPDTLMDLRCLKGEDQTFRDLPAAVQPVLSRLYDDGLARGSEVMELLKHDAPLRKGKCLWFVLIRVPYGQEVLTFVGPDVAALQPQ